MKKFVIKVLIYSLLIGIFAFMWNLMFSDSIKNNLAKFIPGILIGFVGVVLVEAVEWYWTKKRLKGVE